MVREFARRAPAYYARFLYREDIFKHEKNFFDTINGIIGVGIVNDFYWAWRFAALVC